MPKSNATAKSDVTVPEEPGVLATLAVAPFVAVREVVTGMSRLLDTGDEDEGKPWAPAVDVEHYPGELRVTADLAGFKRSDVKVEVIGGSLFISGERAHDRLKDHRGFRQLERHYGRFERSIELPEKANHDHIKVAMSDGLLKITVPMAEEKVRRAPAKKKARRKKRRA